MSEYRDILGQPVDGAGAEVLDLYERLKTLTARDDLPPCIEHNARQALAHMANAARDLNLVFESLLDSHGL